MSLFFVSTVGLILSLATLGLLRPRIPAPWRWQGRGVGVHAGVWLAGHGLLALLFGRAWFAMAIELVFLMLIVQVSNAKFHSLREPFVFQDFEYFTDAIRHPRLYIPFLGWWKFTAIALAVGGAVGVGLGMEESHYGTRLAAGGLLVWGGGLLWVFRRGPLPSYEPGSDLARQGLLACLWDYGWAERQPLALSSGDWGRWAAQAERPDLVVVQSESFFDPRGLSAGVRQDVLAEFDALCASSVCAGPLDVPAWGANTVRSEFAFLSGLAEARLGVHRFNPYRRIQAARLDTLVGRLKGAGYRTVAIHPYPASFYGRDRVFPHLGFDEFIDIGAFAGAERAGPYVADRVVAEKIGEVLAGSKKPVFIFAITMENHGPLHLERVQAEDVPALYETPPPDGCDDLTIYLRHLRNADRMMGKLRQMLADRTRAARLCWYGDHVPIMPEVYRQLGDPDGRTAYFVWDNRHDGATVRRPRALHDLGGVLLSDGS